MPESRFPPIAMLLLLIAAICIYGIILQPGVTFAGMDFLNLGYPRVSLARQAFTSGHMPLWNWYDWGGVPLLASMLGAVLYPPTWIAMLLPLPYGLQVFVFGHLLLAGIGAALVARKIFSLSTPTALICGLIYMGNSFFPGRVEQFQVIAVNSLMPWLVLASVAACQGARTGCWLPVIWLLTLLAGHPQFAVFNAIAALTIAIVPEFRSMFTRSGAIRLGRLAAGFALGTGAAAMQLLPTWELSQLSERIWPYAQPTFPELEWHHLASLIVPKYYNLISGQSGHPFGYTELGLYAGLLAIPLALAGLVASLRSRTTLRTTFVTAAALWIIAMLFALGRNGGIAPWVFENLPFFKNSRGAARSLNIASLMLAILAGRGAMALLSARFIRTRKYKLSMAGLIFAIMVVDLAFQNFSGIKSTLTPISATQARPLLPEAELVTLQEQKTRLYRFMAYDSDLYLNNTSAAVAERIRRMQPNLNSLSQVGLVGGYEEGLLPTRNRANLFRRYNRNLRSDSPDAALLAFLRSNLMLSEFSLPLPDETWRQASPDYPRPSVVPGAGEQPTSYVYWKSRYNPATFLDASLLMSADTIETFFDRAAKSFPVASTDRAPMATERTSHPFESITPLAMTRARQPFTQITENTDWNTVSAVANNASSRALVLLSPYPGWQLKEKKSENYRLKPLSALFYTIHLTDKGSTPQTVQLIFAPFSYRLGVFISLICLSIYLQALISVIKFSVRPKDIVGNS